MRKSPVIGVLSLLVFVLAGCVPVPAGEDTHLKVALIPVLDVLPVFVAEQNGYFASEGIQVETVPVKSPQERDVLMQTSQVDGVLTDLPSTALLNKETVRVKAVYTARRPFPGAPLFRILAAPGSNINTPADLKGVPIGVSQNTTIEYLTDRLLTGAGLAQSDIAVQEVTAITVRFEQLMNGNIKAAVLPDPLAQGAIAAGAKLVIDDSQAASLSQSVLTFRTETLEQKPETVKKFLTAWSKAVEEINANPEKYQDLMIEKANVPTVDPGHLSYAAVPRAGHPQRRGDQRRDPVDAREESALRRYPL